jgi:glycosyltransferase involved in cell wall biosynthesis
MLRSIAVVSFSPIHSDSRVLRQIQALGQHFIVHTIGYGPPPPEVFSHLSLKSHHSWLAKLFGATLLLGRRFEWFHALWFERQRIVSFLAGRGIQLVVLNDVTAWPLARHLPAGVSIMDAHEYSPEELSDQLVWRLFLAPFKVWCSGFAALGSIRFSVEPHLCSQWAEFSGRPFVFLPNSSPYTPPPPPRSLDTASLRVLHHGVAHPSRRIEVMIEAIAKAGPSFSGTFMLAASDQSYLRRLRVLSRICNCDILPPINQDHLIARGADFDVAILSIYPSNLNYQYCLPNKLYQFIQSRLPIVCGPTPAIAAIVHDYQIGVVAEDFTADALASALQSLTSRRLEHMRINLERAARELSWDRDQQILIEAVHSVVNAGT